MQMEHFHNGAAHQHHNRQPHGMAEHGRFKVELAAHGAPGVFQAAVLGGGDAGVGHGAFVFIAALQMGELVIHAAQVVEQALQSVHIGAGMLCGIKL